MGIKKEWVSPALLREWDKAFTYDEISLKNEAAFGGPGKGWAPTRATVQKKMESLGLPPRYDSHRDLIPREWHVLPEHQNEPQRFMLQAVGRARKNPHKPLTDTDRKWIYKLYRIIDTPKPKLCVGYHQSIGFFYRQRRKGIDLDIIWEGPR
jgi:hypothetical protein